jgi:hypothetical protein
LTDRGKPEARVEAICGPGIDPSFDQLISALGHIARHKPKPLIDTIMLWRKQRSEEAAGHRIKLANVSYGYMSALHILLIHKGPTSNFITTVDSTTPQHGAYTKRR